MVNLHPARCRGAHHRTLLIPHTITRRIGEWPPPGAGVRLVDPFRVPVELHEAAKAAMKERLTRVLSLPRGRYLSGVPFGVVLRHITQLPHVRIVPAVSRIARYAVHDHEVVVGVIDTALRQLHHVAMADPREEVTRCRRRVVRAKRADPYACD